MKKFLLRLIVLLIIVVAVAFLARNLIARKAVQIGFTKYTGFPLELGAVSIAPAFGRVEVKDLHLMNTADFEEPTFVKMPTFTVDYQIGSMISGAPHINEMVLDISQVNVVKKANGESNLQKLEGVGGEGSTNAATAKASRKYQIDKVQIHIGTVTVIDKQRGSTHAVPLNISATYENISEATDITRLVLMTMMSRMSLANLGINPNDLTKNLQGVTGGATKALTEGAGAIESSGTSLFNSIKKKIPGQQ